MADSVSLLAVFLRQDLGGCDTTNESWRRGKDLVGESAEYVGFVGGELDRGRDPFFCWGDSLGDSYASRLECNHSPLKGWKWIRL